jgi:hypothetical protein
MKIIIKRLNGETIVLDGFTGDSTVHDIMWEVR